MYFCAILTADITYKACFAMYALPTVMYTQELTYITNICTAHTHICHSKTTLKWTLIVRSVFLLYFCAFDSW